MHINATCGYYWDQWFGCSFEIDIELTGTGKIDDPFILKAKSPYDSKHCELKISHSDQYLKIQGIFLRALYLNHCTNINISDLNVKYFGIRKKETELLLFLLDNRKYLSINDLIKFSGNERTTIQKKLGTLRKKNLISRRKVNMNRGFKYEYKAFSKNLLVTKLNKLITDDYNNKIKIVKKYY